MKDSARENGTISKARERESALAAGTDSFIYIYTHTIRIEREAAFFFFFFSILSFTDKLCRLPWIRFANVCKCFYWGVYSS